MKTGQIGIWLILHSKSWPNPGIEIALIFTLHISDLLPCTALGKWEPWLCFLFIFMLLWENYEDVLERDICLLSYLPCRSPLPPQSSHTSSQQSKHLQHPKRQHLLYLPLKKKSIIEWAHGNSQNSLNTSEPCWIGVSHHSFFLTCSWFLVVPLLQGMLEHQQCIEKFELPVCHVSIS